MGKAEFMIVPHYMDIHKLVVLASEPCERFTGVNVCADDGSLSADAEYGADRYCDPCRLRDAIGHVRLNTPTYLTYKGNVDSLPTVHFIEERNDNA